jgi:hypothetical protein
MFSRNIEKGVTGEGKLIPELNYLSTMPWRRIGRCGYSSIIFDDGTRWRWVKKKGTLLELRRRMRWVMRDLRFLKRLLRILLPSRMWRHVVRYVFNRVSEKALLPSSACKAQAPRSSETSVKIYHFAWRRVASQKATNVSEDNSSSFFRDGILKFWFF